MDISRFTWFLVVVWGLPLPSRYRTELQPWPVFTSKLPRAVPSEEKNPTASVRRATASLKLFTQWATLRGTITTTRTPREV